MTNYYQKFNNYFHGIIAVPLLAFSILYLEFDQGNLQPVFGGKNYYLESGILFLLSVVYIGYMFRKLRISISNIESGSLESRLANYSRISIRFYAMVTLPGAIAVLLMYLTGELSLSLIYILELFLLSIRRPSLTSIVRDLKLSGREKDIVIKRQSLNFQSKDE